MHSTTHPNSYQTALGVVDRDLHSGIKRRIPGHAQRLEQEKTNATKPARIFPILRHIVLATAVMLIIAVALFLTAVYFGDGLSRAGHSVDETKLEVVVANNVLAVPANVIRFPVQRRNGIQQRLDLYLHWPSLTGYSDALSAEFNRADDKTDLIFLTLEPRTMSFDMSGRLNPIYSVFFNGLGVRTDGGLVRQPLDESGGFIDEDMYYQADSPYPFAARCVREASSIGAPFCIRDVHIGKDLMVTYRFHKRFLSQWFELDQAVRNHANSLVVNQS